MAHDLFSNVMQKDAPTTSEWEAEAACRQIAALCPPLDAEHVPLSQALGRRLRETVRATEDLPPFDRSAMDGYAIRHNDPATRFTVVDRLRAGDWRPRPLQPGQAVAIATGAALPDTGLQVVPRELVREEGDTIELLERPRDDHIRHRGDDARAGDVLVPEGTLLQPGTLALLASLGHARPRVTRRPVVWHLVTGNELVPPEQSPGPGQIRDSNSLLVRTFLEARGIPPAQWRLPEDETAMRELLQPLGAGTVTVDLLLVSGGASVGPHDFTRRILEECGYEIVISRVRARPGRPLIVARRGSSLAFGLPGNPLAHFVCLHLYVNSALRAWDGAPHSTPAWFTGRLAHGLHTEPGRYPTFWPARWTFDAEGRAEVQPLRWQSSGDLTPLATANALLRLPARPAASAAGSPVSFLPLHLEP